MCVDDRGGSGDDAGDIMLKGRQWEGERERELQEG